MSLRNLVHCALAMVVAFSGIAALYLQLDAQFVGFAEILVYVGAIAILIVFAILLTRSDASAGKKRSDAGLGGRHRGFGRWFSPRSVGRFLNSSGAAERNCPPRPWPRSKTSATR